MFMGVLPNPDKPGLNIEVLKKRGEPVDNGIRHKPISDFGGVGSNLGHQKFA
jgi:hypothetical protein